MEDKNIDIGYNEENYITPEHLASKLNSPNEHKREINLRNLTRSRTTKSVDEPYIRARLKANKRTLVELPHSMNQSKVYQKSSSQEEGAGASEEYKEAEVKITGKFADEINDEIGEIVEDDENLENEDIEIWRENEDGRAGQLKNLHQYLDQRPLESLSQRSIPEEGISLELRKGVKPMTSYGGGGKQMDKWADPSPRRPLIPKKSSKTNSKGVKFLGNEEQMKPGSGSSRERIRFETMDIEDEAVDSSRIRTLSSHKCIQLTRRSRTRGIDPSLMLSECAQAAEEDDDAEDQSQSPNPFERPKSRFYVNSGREEHPSSSRDHNELEGASSEAEVEPIQIQEEPYSPNQEELSKANHPATLNLRLDTMKADQAMYKRHLKISTLGPDREEAPTRSLKRSMTSKWDLVKKNYLGKIQQDVFSMIQPGKLNSIYEIVKELQKRKRLTEAQNAKEFLEGREIFDKFISKAFDKANINANEVRITTEDIPHSESESEDDEEGEEEEDSQESEKERKATKEDPKNTEATEKATRRVKYRRIKTRKDYDIQLKLVEPSYQKLQIYLNENYIRDRGKAYSLPKAISEKRMVKTASCLKPRKTVLDKGGPGLNLFFGFLKVTIILFFICFVISVPIQMTNIGLYKNSNHPILKPLGDAVSANIFGFIIATTFGAISSFNQNIYALRFMDPGSSKRFLQDSNPSSETSTPQVDRTWKRELLLSCEYGHIAVNQNFTKFGFVERRVTLDQFQFSIDERCTDYEEVMYSLQPCIGKNFCKVESRASWVNLTDRACLRRLGTGDGSEFERPVLALHCKNVLMRLFGKPRNSIIKIYTLSFGGFYSITIFFLFYLIALYYNRKKILKFYDLTTFSPNNFTLQLGNLPAYNTEPEQIEFIVSEILKYHIRMKRRNGRRRLRKTHIQDQDTPIVDIQVVQPHNIIKICKELYYFEQKKQIKMMKMIAQWKTAWKASFKEEFLCDLQKLLNQKINTKQHSSRDMDIALVKDAGICRRKRITLQNSSPPLEP